jgi:hypothetical protein
MPNPGDVISQSIFLIARIIESFGTDFDGMCLWLYETEPDTAMSRLSSISRGTRLSVSR